MQAAFCLLQGVVPWTEPGKLGDVSKHMHALQLALPQHSRRSTLAQPFEAC